MALQRQIALEHTSAMIGQKIRVLVEAPGIARSEMDAPEVDARVFVPKHLPVGEFATLTVSGANEYDLIAL